MGGVGASGRGGVFSGVFAISEAAAVTALYVIFAEVVLYKEVTFKQLGGVAVESMVMVGGILMILGIALGFTNYLVDAEVPQQLMVSMQTYIKSPLGFLLLLNVLLLALGAMLDIFSALVIMVPLLLPVAVGYGIHPVHLGIIFLANISIMMKHVTLLHALQQQPANNYRAMLYYVSLVG